MKEDIEECICQSCGMPIKNQNDFGTEKDGQKSPYYCTYCYMKGLFLEPELTPSEMVDICAKKYEERKIMPFDEAYELNLKIIPELRRWKFK
ncbi:zinc ribbon domain-containing protein [Methanomicrobium antiquum]|uniref:Zinc ribbon domain-containing protein n=1 Tax=Methanomicrobium antiquum TaxID=487686 RepID=A0AAF0FN18_9EURY|nr:zinc ribbon domain-containing protein [Methanomicrobium antiquum]WFN36472.1 zinc ribbon domain-containing protein [Methanomicrobium antiquum]